MRIGIIGSGMIGSTAARLAVAARHEVAIANSRGPASLRELVGELGDGVQAVSVEEAAQFGDVVLVAIPLKSIGTLPPAAFAGTVVIDANNYYPARDGTLGELDADRTTSSELLAAHLAGAKVVKAFNTMYFETLATAGDRGARPEERLALFMAGDDAAAKGIVAAFIDSLGFTAVDTGSLREGGRRQQPGSPLYDRPMTAAQARQRLDTLDA